MRRRWLLGLGLLFGTVVGVAAQGSLSQQVLQLLTRNNTWSGVNTYANTVGLTLESGLLAPSTTTNRLYNIGGNLYFNGALVATSAGVGTVTSVGLALPSIFTVTISPIATAGTLTAVLAVENANKVWAGPTTGADAAPTFRALVAADIPDLSATYLTPAGAQAVSNKTGNISQWTNDSGYLTTLAPGSASITTVGTVTTGTWNATVIAGQYGGTGVANTGKTITLGGNLTTSGAFTTTFAVTGNTSVTLPTSGTLVNSSVATLSSLTSVGTIGTGVWQGTAVGAQYGGTGQSSYTTGDLLQASAATTLSKLAAVATGNVLLSGGVGTVSAWGKVGLATHVSGTLGVANGGTANTAVPTNGQLLIGNGATYALATLTGTANQITVTNGAGTITLATPQSIGTGSTPQFARLGLGAAAGATAVVTTTGQFDLGLFDNGNCGAADTVDWNAGQIQKSTLTAATCTYTFANPITGATYHLLVIQDGTGGRLVTWPGTVTWLGGTPVLSITPGATDVCTFLYDGAAYQGTCQLLTGSSGGVQSRTKSLTDAQVKALPTTAIDLVPAQGSGTRIYPVQVLLDASFAAGAYTNVNATSSCAVAPVSAEYTTNAIVNSAAATVTKLDSFLGAAHSLAQLVPFAHANVAQDLGNYAEVTTISAASQNVALQLSCNNGGSGNFTGGNAANTLGVTVYYVVR